MTTVAEKLGEAVLVALLGAAVREVAIKFAGVTTDIDILTHLKKRIGFFKVS